jgi:predicted nucleotidyltransferase
MHAREQRHLFLVSNWTPTPLIDSRRGRRRINRVGRRRAEAKPSSGKESDASRLFGINRFEDFFAANYVRLLAKLDALDDEKNDIERGDEEDDASKKMNIYGHVATIDLSDDGSILDEGFLRRLHEPVLIRNAFEKTRGRGGGGGGAASSSWTIRKLLEAHEEEEKRTGGAFQTTVRVRTSINSDRRKNEKSFVYAEQSHEAIRNRKFQPPSLTQRMPFALGLSRVLELSGDGAYIQSELPESLKDDMERDYLRVFSAFEKSDEFVESQPLRLWLSKRGSVSPLHFDASISTLTQLKGEKTFLLFAPFSGLSRCNLYPDWHPLRRRSRLSIDDERIRTGLRAYQATLSEGDVLIFPPRWLHHVESSNKTNTSVSITRRYIHNGSDMDTSYASRFARWAKIRDKGTKALSRLYSSRLVDGDFPTRFNLAVIDLDNEGKCPKLCETRSFEKDVQEKWRLCTQTLSDCIFARMKNVSSICVRGSIARGAAVDIESDCDMIVIFESKRPSAEELEALRSELEDIRSKDFPFAKKIDVRFEVRGKMNAEQLFTLATSSLCVSGEDIPKSLSRMPPVRTCFPTLCQDVDVALENGSEKAISWACKRCLRAAFESQKRTRFTREISRCCEIVCKEDYPEKKYEVGDLETALVIAIKGPKMVFGDAHWLEMSKALLNRLSNCISLASI